jgi:PBP1b-binding outer membrane lipoprotein LpoB
MRSTLVKVAALIAAGMVVLSGCATAGDPNVAVTVNGEVLTETRVTELSQAISEVGIASWKAQQESTQPAASRTPEEQATYETELAKQQVDMAPGKYRVAVVGASIQAQLARDAAKVANITVTDAQRQEVISQNGLSALSANPVTKDLVDGLANVQVVFTNASGLQAGKEAAAKAEVQLNPRYGTWDPSQLTLTGTGSLSTSTTAQR